MPGEACSNCRNGHPVIKASLDFKIILNFWLWCLHCCHHNRHHCHHDHQQVSQLRRGMRVKTTDRATCGAGIILQVDHLKSPSTLLYPVSLLSGWWSASWTSSSRSTIFCQHLDLPFSFRSLGWRVKPFTFCHRTKTRRRRSSKPGKSTSSVPSNELANTTQWKTCTFYSIWL